MDVHVKDIRGDGFDPVDTGFLDNLTMCNAEYVLIPIRMSAKADPNIQKSMMVHQDAAAVSANQERRSCNMTRTKMVAVKTGMARSFDQRNDASIVPFLCRARTIHTQGVKHLYPGAACSSNRDVF